MKLLPIFAALSLPASAVTITQWDFNSTTPDGNTGTGITTPSTGSGAVTLIGGTTSIFASGDAGGGSTDPATGDDSALNLTTFPALSAGNETAGIRVDVSTVGFNSITVGWDQRHSNSTSRFIAFYYTLNGTDFTRLSLSAANASAGATPSGGSPASTAGLFGGNGTFSAFDGTVTGAGDDWFNGRSVDLSAISGASDNANFGFRIVTSFGSGIQYEASSSSAYAGGTQRFDRLTVSGSAIPEPTSALLGSLGVFALLRRRRIG